MFSSIVSILNKRCQDEPHRNIFTFLKNGISSDYLSYQLLDQRARIIARYIKEQKLEQQPIILMYTPGLNFISAFFGCLYAKAFAVPVYPPYTKEISRRIQLILRETSAKVIFIDHSTSILLHKFKLIKAFSKAPIIGSLAKILNKNLSKQGDLPDWDDLVWVKTDLLESNTYLETEAVTEDQIAFLQYTSGSTDNPKGVMVTHANIMNNLQLIQDMTFATEKSTGVIWAPLQHDMGLMTGVLLPIFTNFHLVLMSPLEFLTKPYLWLKAISDYKATHSGGPSFSYHLCTKKISSEQLATLNLKSWEVAFNSAEPVRLKHIEDFCAKFSKVGFCKNSFAPSYGLAESTLAISIHKRGTPLSVLDVKPEKLVTNEVEETHGGLQLVSSGKIPDNIKVRIVNVPDFRICPPCTIGEIWVSSPSVAKGYFNQPQQSEHIFQAQTFDGDGPYLRTGDLGFIKDGELYITGRLKDVIIIRGQNYYPQDIEHAVENSNHELRKGCSIAFSVESDEGETIVVVSELKNSQTKCGKEICRSIEHAIYKNFYLSVHTIVLIKPRTIPKTSSGKLQRYLCREKFLSGQLDIVFQERLL